MFRPRLASLFASLMLVTAASVQAQTFQVDVTANHAPNSAAVPFPWGGYSSPYAGTINGNQVSLFCDDFFHSAIVGVTFTAVSTNLGQAIGNLNLLTNTRDGSNGAFGSLSQSLVAYEEMAWLTDQMPKIPSSNPKLAEAIQTAIWAIGSFNASNVNYKNVFPTSTHYFGNGGIQNSGGFTSSTGPNDTGYWITQAASQYALQNPGYYQKFEIYTDVNKSRPGCASTATSYTGCSAQEYIIATPEPATLTLLASGFTGLLGAGIVRRRRSIEA